MPDDTIGDLARQDLYPDERYMQPPVNPVDLPPEAYASLGGGDLGLLGSKGVAGLFGVPSWLQKAQDLGAKDIANYQSGGVPAMMGSLADTSDAQDLAGGFGGNIKGVKASVVPGALAALGDYHPPFYSAVERAVQDAKQNAAPGQQWAGFLRNQPGVKPEEVEALGLGKLFEQPGAVPKQAVLGEIAANRVNVGTVMKGARPSSEGGEWIGPGQYRMEGGVEWSPTTKFSQYTLPGGENYREMLLTLPTADAPKAARMTEIEGLLQERRPGEEAYRAALRDEYKQLADETRDSPTFKSSHFDEPNVLAHVRYNDRVIDGKKTLFVEEVQSDWHQKGKREGYGLQITPEAESLMPEIRKLGISEDPNNISSKMITDAGGDYNLATKWWNLVHDRQVVVSKGPPDAPFKTTWPDLAMKRVIREAAEKGYDKVAWTPGSVQADRYDLSKQVSRVRYTNNDYLHAFDHNGKEVIAQAGVTPEKLADYLGKDVAQKMLDQTPKDFQRMTHVNRGDLKVEQSEHQYHVTNPDGRGVNIGRGTVGSEGEALDYAERYLNKTADEVNQKRLLAHEHHGPVRELSGLDLKVGGEGMKGFYDEILPAAVNKIVKKAGGRVEQGDIGGAALSPAERAELKGLQQNWDRARGEVPEADVSRMADLQNRLGSKTVHTLDITPQLREMALKKGFPLFTAGGIAATGMMGDLAKQDEYQ